MKKYLPLKTSTITKNLTYAVIILLLIAIGVTINDNLSQKSLTTQAQTATDSSLDMRSLSPTTQFNPPLTLPASSAQEAKETNTLEQRMLDILKKIVEAIR